MDITMSNLTQVTSGGQSYNNQKLPIWSRSDYRANKET